MSEKFICRVCGKEFELLYDHLEEFQDEAHEKYWDYVYSKLFLLPDDRIRCFCGGKLEVWYNVVSEDGDETWEIRCEKCNYLWDDD